MRHFLATGKGPMLNKRVEITGYHRDGHEIPIELAISPALGQEGNYTFSAFVRDISERKQTEEQSRMHLEELQRLNQALDRRVQARTQELASVNESLLAEVAERMQTEASLESSRQELQKLAFQLLRVQEDERLRTSPHSPDDDSQSAAGASCHGYRSGRTAARFPTRPGRPSRLCDTRSGCGIVRCGAAFGLPAASIHSR